MAEDDVHEVTITIAHFNDVYHISNASRIARFSTTLSESKPELIIFSGDALSPSLESSILKGEHMIPVLNHLGIDVACYGNHDLDFGEQRLTELSAQCNFPWLLSNASAPSDSPLASAHPHFIKQVGPLRLGLFGLAGTDRPSNCQHLPSDAHIEDPAECSTRMAAVMREEYSVDVVIAVTHMRMEEDLDVVSRCSGVDLILGGHDHDYMIRGSRYTESKGHAEGDIRVVKSGTDFREFSVVKVHVDKCQDSWRIRMVEVDRVQENDFGAEDPRTLAIIANVDQRIASLSHGRIAYTAVPLHGLTSHVRSAETNLGNLLADAVRAYYDTDIAFVNSGSIRCDRVIPAGALTVRDIIDAVPFDNPWVVKRISGQVILQALENSVSDLRSDGRFLQLSGLNMVVNFSRSEGRRILSASLSSGAPLENDTAYTVTMQRFIAEGFDGYSLFRDAVNLVDTEAAITDTSLLMALLSSERRHVADKASDGSDERLVRAARAIVVGTREGLPVLSPMVTGRIRTV